MHESVDVAELPEVRVTLVGLNVHVKPAGETLEVSATVPAKPLMLVTVIVDVAAVPALTATLVGLAAIVKSGAGFTTYDTVVL